MAVARGGMPPNQNPTYFEGEEISRLSIISISNHIQKRTQGGGAMPRFPGLGIEEICRVKDHKTQEFPGLCPDID